MTRSVSPAAGYAVAAGLGVLAGGAMVALMARVLPRAMSRAMAGMVRDMMGREGGAGHNLPDI